MGGVRGIQRPDPDVETLRLVTEDRVVLRGLHLPARPDPDPGRRGRPGQAAASDLALVVTHGFTCSTSRPAFRAICRRLSAFGGVVACDFRGHGGSAGWSTLGAREVLDVCAAVRWARDNGYRRVATLGFSMGGSVVLRHAALYRGAAGVDAVASVSAPSRWFVLDTPPMRRVHWLCETALGRATARVMGTRIGRGWHVLPQSPVELVDRIRPVPLLVVHGDRDSYFSLDHPRALAAAAGPGVELWVEAGYGHAENAASPDLVDRIGSWLADRSSLRRSGTIPR